MLSLFGWRHYSLGLAPPSGRNRLPLLTNQKKLRKTFEPLELGAYLFRKSVENWINLPITDIILAVWCYLTAKSASVLNDQQKSEITFEWWKLKGKYLLNIGRKPASKFDCWSRFRANVPTFSEVDFALKTLFQQDILVSTEFWQETGIMHPAGDTVSHASALAQSNVV